MTAWNLSVSKTKWAVFKIQWVCLQAFPSFPSPSPLFYPLNFLRVNSLLPNPTETWQLLRRLENDMLIYENFYFLLTI